MKNIQRAECKKLHYALSKFQGFIPDLNATELEKKELNELTYTLQQKLTQLSFRQSMLTK
jgi:hypothetical protein